MAFGSKRRVVVGVGMKEAMRGLGGRTNNEKIVSTEQGSVVGRVRWIRTRSLRYSHIHSRPSPTYFPSNTPRAPPSTTHLQSTGDVIAIEMNDPCRNKGSSPLEEIAVVPFSLLIAPT